VCKRSRETVVECVWELPSGAVLVIGQLTVTATLWAEKKKIRGGKGKKCCIAKETKPGEIKYFKSRALGVLMEGRCRHDPTEQIRIEYSTRSLKLVICEYLEEGELNEGTKENGWGVCMRCTLGT